MDTESIKSKILVILGSTSTGKTDLALFLANKINGEIISCDSRQVYIGLDIGTGKNPSEISNFKFQISKNKGNWIINHIKVWMYDVVDPKRQYSVANYVKDAEKIIKDIRMREKLPIIVGGSGLYLKALIYGLSNLSTPPDRNLRKKLDKLSLIQLQERFKKNSPEKWEKMNNSDRQNPRRLVRAIELLMAKPQKRKEFKNNFDILKIGLTTSREILYQRVDEGVISRINKGMIKETIKLYKDGLSLKRMRQLGLEYGILTDYLQGKIKNIDDLTKIMQYKIHSYVRRQLTWFKKEKDIHWFNIEDKNFYTKVENIVAKWYHPN